jgi:flagellin FlaB
MSGGARMPMPNKRRGIADDERGFTGLEAAIVLTAFIVVAAVFSYMVLGAGFFSTEKAKEVVHTGVETATSSAELSGDVIGHGWMYGEVVGSITGATTAILGTWNRSDYTNPNNYTVYWSYYAWNETTDKNKLDSTNLTVVEFQIQLTAGQEPINMNKIVLSYSDNDTYAAYLSRSTNTNASKGNLTMGTWTYTLATDETGSANMLDQKEKMTIIVALPEYGVKADEELKIDLKPPKGGSVSIIERAPSAIYKTMLLYD